MTASMLTLTQTWTSSEHREIIYVLLNAAAAEQLDNVRSINHEFILGNRCRVEIIWGTHIYVYAYIKAFSLWAL